jgi:hypothetical protein
MNPKFRFAVVGLATLALFAAGFVAGQNKYGTPSSIIHVVIIKWKADAPEAERQKAIEGVKKMAAEIPGIKNVWMKATRVQPRDYHTAFVLEFENREAADRYAEHPARTRWAEHYLSIREASISVQATN